MSRAILSICLIGDAASSTSVRKERCEDTGVSGIVYGANRYSGKQVSPAKGARVVIGDNCDIGSFVSINCSDSHKRCIGLKDEIDKQDIVIENNVYIGTQSFIGGGVHIGHHSVVGAGTIVRKGDYPPYSLIVGNPAVVKPGYYEDKIVDAE